MFCADIPFIFYTVVGFFNRFDLLNLPKYREKRMKNNEAARRSREKKRKHEVELEDQVRELKNENSLFIRARFNYRSVKWGKVVILKLNQSHIETYYII